MTAIALCFFILEKSPLYEGYNIHGSSLLISFGVIGSSFLLLRSDTSQIMSNGLLKIVHTSFVFYAYILLAITPVITQMLYFIKKKATLLQWLSLILTPCIILTSDILFFAHSFVGISTASIIITTSTAILIYLYRLPKEAVLQ
jgi:hypothetical protein